MMMVVSKITIQVLQGLLLGELVATYPTVLHTFQARAKVPRVL